MRKNKRLKPYTRNRIDGDEENLRKYWRKSRKHNKRNERCTKKQFRQLLKRDMEKQIDEKPIEASLFKKFADLKTEENERELDKYIDYMINEWLT